MAFGQPTMAVDTHIFRIGNRIGLAPGKTPEQVEAGLSESHPAEFMRHAHHWLILHGRYVCKARKPDCPRCVIADICKAAEKTTSMPAPLVEIAPVAGTLAGGCSVADAARHRGGEYRDQGKDGDLRLDPGADGKDFVGGDPVSVIVR